MNQEISAAKQICEQLYAAVVPFGERIVATPLLVNLYQTAMQSEVKTSEGRLKDGIKIEVDFDTAQLGSIEVQKEFKEFYLEHRATVTKMLLLYNMWERYVPHRPPTNEELAEMGWPSEWVNTHYEFLEQFA